MAGRAERGKGKDSDREQLGYCRESLYPFGRLIQTLMLPSDFDVCVEFG